MPFICKHAVTHNDFISLTHPVPDNALSVDLLRVLPNTSARLDAANGLK